MKTRILFFNCNIYYRKGVRQEILKFTNITSAGSTLMRVSVTSTTKKGSGRKY